MKDENYKSGYEAGQKFYGVIIDKLAPKDQLHAIVNALEVFRNSLEENYDERHGQKDEASE